MFNSYNIDESAANNTFQNQSSPLSGSPLSSCPLVSHTPKSSLDHISEALATALLNDIKGVDLNTDVSQGFVNQLANSMSPTMNLFTQSPQGASSPVPIPGANPFASQTQPDIVSGSFPSLANLQQYNTATNTLINDLQILSLYSNLSNLINPASVRAPQIQGQSASNIGNGAFQTNNRERYNNPRKVRQQEQFSANKERTIYVSEVHPDVTEADIAILFSRCGDVVDCRLCGDAHSKMRFAFVEFSVQTWTFAVPESLKLNNSLLCGAPIRVQRSKTAIVPIKRDLLPQNEEEMVRCARTVYACNIDRRFTKMDVQAFFEALAVDESMEADGRVSRIKMMADGTSKTIIAFVEFCSDESAASALHKCQGALMGCLPLRVSPSKTPIRTPEEEKTLRESRFATLYKN